MKLTRHDTPLAHGRHAPLHIDDAPGDTPLTQAAIAEGYGLHPMSVVKFRRRHPECKAWPIERICQQMVANKNQADVARRQGQRMRPGQRPVFKEMRYA